MESEWVLAFVFNAVLIAIAQRLPFLTPMGWVHAGALGTILLGCLGWNAWLAVAVYLILGTLVTKIGFVQKQAAGLAEGRGGRRGPENVWGSAATGAILAILIKADFASESLLIVGFAASFAAKLADTFGSEIGKRWGRRTVLITNFRPVPAGTDGAISLQGTLASVLGSVLMTTAMVALKLIPLGSLALLVASVGVLATLLESFFGAIAQNRMHWLTNEMINGLQTTTAALIAIFLVPFLG